jgi:hypothetical protein
MKHHSSFCKFAIFVIYAGQAPVIAADDIQSCRRALNLLVL